MKKAFSSMPMRLLGGAVLTCVVLAAALTVKNSAAQADKAEQAKGRAALTVTTITPMQDVWPVALSVSGGLAAWQQAVISSEIGGQRIVRVLADVGDRVKKGQVLVALSQDMVLADVRRQEASVAQARASMNEARVNAERARSIKDSGAMSAQQINQYLVAEETGKAALAAASAQLESERLRLTQTKIMAPDDGIIFSRSAELGAVVAAGAELFRMVRQGKIEWRAEVSSQQLPLVQVGHKARLVLPGGKTVEGTVRMIAPTLDAATRNAFVYVDLPQNAVDAGARAGMYVSGQIVSGDKPALTLPQSAIVLRDGNSYVYELGADNKVVQRQVMTGRYNGTKVEIVSGIHSDSRIVQTGGAFLSDGDHVNVAATQPGVLAQ